jgi:hypothetical protein
VKCCRRRTTWLERGCEKMVRSRNRQDAMAKLRYPPVPWQEARRKIATLSAEQLRNWSLRSADSCLK